MDRRMNLRERAWTFGAAAGASAPAPRDGLRALEQHSASSHAAPTRARARCAGELFVGVLLGRVVGHARRARRAVAWRWREPARAAARADRAPAATGAGRADRARGGARPVGARPQRLGERLLQRRRALDELELAQLPLRLGRSERRDDRRQAAARPVGAVAVGSRVRLSPAEHARAAGADGRRERRAALRPRAAALRPNRRVRRRARARADADHGRDLAPQQPRRAADPLLRRRAVVHRARARRRPHALARARRRVASASASRRRCSSR